jgi:group I intron endonuclease
MHSTDDLKDGYLGSGKYLKNSVNYYGKENFKLEILEFFDSREILIEKEKELVNKDFIKVPLCMNLSIGGTSAPIGNKHGSGKRSKEQCQKMSDNWYSKKRKTQEWKDNLGTSWIGKKHSEESKQKMSVVRKGKNLVDIVGEEKALDWRKKISDGGKIKIFTEEHKKNISLSKIGCKRPDITVSKSKMVNQFDINGNFIERYNSLKLASNKTGCHISKISDVCRGTRRHTRNFIWKFVI